MRDYQIYYLKMTIVSCPRTSALIAREASASEPLQGLQLASACCEEEKERKKSEAKTKKEKTLWGRILTCIHGDVEVKLFQRFEELLKQRQVAM